MSTHDHPYYGSDVPRPSGSPTQPSGGQFTPPPQTPYYYHQEPQAGCGTYLFRMFLILGVLGVCCFLALLFIGVLAASISVSFEEAMVQKEEGLTEKFIGGNKSAEQKIAVLSIEGMITGSDEGFVAKQIRQVLKDKDVKGIVLRIDSPGGTMSGSDYYHYKLNEMKTDRNIPVVVSMGSIAASGGYYIAMVGDEVFAEHSTITGSIGVIVPLYKAVELSKKIGVESTPITSGEFKSMGSLLRPMDDAEKEIWQRLVDDSFVRFKNVILDGRKELKKEELDKLATGQIFTAAEAKEKKLIDEIGFLDDAIKAALNRAGLTENDTKIIRYKPRKGFADLILEGHAAESRIMDPKSLLDATTPRVYLICPQVLPIGN